MYGQPNLILVILIVIWALVTITISVYTYINIVESRKQIIKGNSDAAKLLKEIYNETYKEGNWL